MGKVQEEDSTQSTPWHRHQEAGIMFPRIAYKKETEKKV
jgi:hypothetical protein